MVEQLTSNTDGFVTRQSVVLDVPRKETAVVDIPVKTRRDADVVVKVQTIPKTLEHDTIPFGRRLELASGQSEPDTVHRRFRVTEKHFSREEENRHTIAATTQEVKALEDGKRGMKPKQFDHHKVDAQPIVATVVLPQQVRNLDADQLIRILLAKDRNGATTDRAMLRMANSLPIPSRRALVLAR